MRIFTYYVTPKSTFFIGHTLTHTCTCNTHTHTHKTDIKQIHAHTHTHTHSYTEIYTYVHVSAYVRSPHISTLVLGLTHSHAYT